MPWLAEQQIHVCQHNPVAGGVQERSTVHPLLTSATDNRQCYIGARRRATVHQGAKRALVLPPTSLTSPGCPYRTQHNQSQHPATPSSTYRGVKQQAWLDDSHGLGLLIGHLHNLMAKGKMGREGVKEGDECV
jgi:hypothetical protein